MKPLAGPKRSGARLEPSLRAPHSIMSKMAKMAGFWCRKMHSSSPEEAKGEEDKKGPVPNGRPNVCIAVQVRLRICEILHVVELLA